MRIQRLDLHSYGAFRGRSLDLTNPEHGLIVVLGPNEAGKSTAMRAIDALLFGIERGSADHFGSGRQSLRIGACRRSDDGTEIEVVRQGLTGKRLVDPTGAAVTEEALAAIVGDVDRTFFRTMFRIDHRELTERSEELLRADGEIGRIVFGAGLGTVALNDVLRRLDATSDALFRPRATNPKLNAAIGEYRALTKDARSRRVKPRDWADLDRDLQRARREADVLRDQRDVLRREGSRLDRIAAALPLLTSRQDAIERAEEVAASGPVSDAAWADEVRQLLEDVDAGGHQIRLLDHEADSLGAELEGITIEPLLLDSEDRITQLHQEMGRFRKDQRDLPKLTALVEEHHGAIEATRARLGSGSSRAVSKLTDAQRNEITSAADQAASITTELRAAQHEVRRLSDRVVELEAELGAMPDAPDLDTLERAITLSLKAGDLDDQVETATSTRASLEQRATTTARRLGVSDGSRTIAEIEATPVPARARVAQERDLRTAIENEIRGIATTDRQRRDEREALVAERGALDPTSTIPDQDELTAARAHRDAGWLIVRGVLDDRRDDAAAASWSGGIPLPHAYETAVSAADDAADRRYEHADQLARIEEIDRRIAAIDAELAANRQELDTIERRQADLSAGWAAVWSDVAVVPDTPDVAAEWLEEHRKLLDDLTALRSIEGDLDRSTTARDGHIQQLQALLVAHGSTSTSDSLTMATEQAGQLLSQLQQVANARQGLERQLRELRSQQLERERDLDEARRDHEQWSARWNAALEPLGLPAGTSVEAARTTVQLIGELAKQQLDHANAERRRDGLQSDIDAFEHDVRATALVLAPESVDDDPEHIVSELHRRLAATSEARVRRDGLTDRLEQNRLEAGARQRALDHASERLIALRRRAGLGAEVDLDQVARRSELLAAAQEHLADLERTLVDVGEGRSVEELAADGAAFGMDPDRLAAERDDTSAKLDQRDAELADANARCGELQTRLDQIDGSSDAANLDEQAAMRQAEALQHLDEYVRAHLAAAVLRRVIAGYGAQHQQPILLDATEIFSTLTGGAFVELLPDDDGSQQILLARRRNGELLHTAEMSTGTRDQLYLAIRMAGIRHQLQSMEERLPIVLDDLLVHFDDERSAAALEVLATMAVETQVLMFTHEPNVAELATRTLGPERSAVLKLPRRDQEVPVEVTEQRRPTVTTDSTRGELVLDCLREAVDPLGKAQILASTGISDEEWKPLIKQLVDSGAIRRTGAKRGARYHIAPSP